jgi:hypothetical protein
MKSTVEGWKVIKDAPVTRGWSIALIEAADWQTGEPIWLVARVNPQGKFLKLSSHGNYAKAQAAANREWSADREATS